MKSFVFVAFFVVLFLSGCKKDESNPTQPPTSAKTGTIKGIVRDKDSGTVVQGAIVQTIPNTTSTVTNDSGAYTMPDVPIGAYNIFAVKTGYIADTVGVTVTENKTTTAELIIKQGTVGAPGTPALSEPADSTVDVQTNPLLIWFVSDGADTYTLQISTSKTFSTLLFNEGGITITQKQITGLTSITSYYWRVRAVNQKGNSAWSATRVFTVTLGVKPQSPILSYPASNDTNVSLAPEFRWSKSIGTVSYNLEVSKSSSFGVIIFSVNAVKDTFCKASNLDTGSTHYWRVSATNRYGSSTSSSRTFITAGPLPPKPFLFIPANGDSGLIPSAVTLTWQPVYKAVSYTLQVAKDSSFSNFVLNQSGITGTSSQISNLKEFTKYFWRVNARNEVGISEFSAVRSFKTANSCRGTTTLEYSGRIYNTVSIGTQCWLKENLDVGVYVPSNISSSGHSDVSNNGIIEKYCYNNTTSNCDIYGGLYDWNEAMGYVTTTGARGICPPGWHIPTLSEIQACSTTVGGNGNSLKAIGQGAGNGAGTNISDFSALLGGGRVYSGPFYGLVSDARFWSSSEVMPVGAFAWFLVSNDSKISSSNVALESGQSIRCLKD